MSGTTHGTLADAIDALPPNDRAPFVLRFWSVLSPVDRATCTKRYLLIDAIESLPRLERRAFVLRYVSPSRALRVGRA